MAGGEGQKNSAVDRAATAMSVIEGALAFIVISFVATVWESIPTERGNDAFVVMFGSGAHFLFSFGIVAPILAVPNRLKSGAMGIAMMLALFGYVFQSLILQHRGLAGLLLDEPWTIPIAPAAAICTALDGIFGAQFALYIGPLIFSYLVLAIALPIGWAASMAFKRK